MDNFREFANDLKHRRRFEHLLFLAAERGDADLVAERLGWGVDPNCTFGKARTPLMANMRDVCPSAAAARALLKHGADPGLTDEGGLTALDYARRKLMRLMQRKDAIPPLAASQRTTALRSGDFGSPVLVCSHSLRGRGIESEEVAFAG